ncbi:MULTISPECIES: ParM/StbA family protein [Ectothiorhodospira]|uniref:Plasmid segregation protein ParM n=1 Tax=Ectothiorhodospira marina TaxID=1396821 RepID=A0A1H7KBC4_9GAMM|nr:MULTISPECIES: ParM/StbA family protein [Ectothiorhodospira]MCG5515741.1 ParM/StbA family protein [Ectothiorhodospira sp. 9100]MCG5519132.1 ParM/StbA family protein [Ectothiorhodospira sp. 9905]SEK83277.1 plasmid segregation protein ParM [Ectothiorhodospira marina]
MDRCIGLDMGYGYIKAEDGQNGYVFPSVVGEAGTQAPMSLGFKRPPPTEDLRISVGGREYFLGDLAIRHSRIAYRGLSSTRAEGDDILILCLGTLALYCKDSLNSFFVVTGLPPGRMHMADDLVRRLQGDHEVIRRVGNQRHAYSVRLDRIDVVPQPVGTFWSMVLDDRGNLREDSPMLDGRVGIIDVGFRTSDFATIVDGEYAPAFSRTVPIGISHGYDEIADLLNARYGLERETYTLDEAIIEGELNVSGRKVDITGLRDQVFQDLATKLLVEINSLWQVDDYPFVLITGGGGQVMSRYLREMIPHARTVDEPITANARGFHAWARYNALQAGMGERASEDPSEDDGAKA